MKDINNQETQEWLESMQALIEAEGTERAHFILQKLITFTKRNGISIPFSANTDYINTISANQQKKYPGDIAIEKRITSLIRWNAMAMVVQANRNFHGIGGHISSYASSATLLEVGFNHFFKGPEHADGSDLIYFQGHSSPGIYARSFLEGRFNEKQLHNFRRELQKDAGLSSYPHPWLMPNYWQFATVSMGLAAIQGIYQARFLRYIEDREIAKTKNKKVWVFLGDGEMDEPESLGALTLAAREKLDNLIFVVNCNLQRLDGPVRGNSKIIQELEGAFRGAGWNVIKVIWGNDWDPIIEQDKSGKLIERMNDLLDGEALKYIVEGGNYIRNDFWGKYPELLKTVENYSDDKLNSLNLGGHDPEKIYSAYHSATIPNGKPTVILAHTIKGYGLGEAGEGRNITHQQKELNEKELINFRTRFDIPLSNEECVSAPFYCPPKDSDEIKYLIEQRSKLGGFIPKRNSIIEQIKYPQLDIFQDFLNGSDGRKFSTTMAFVKMLSNLLKDKNIGNKIVPIIPDEARTFGIDPLFRTHGIYSHQGQKYDPVDSDQYLYYKEDKKGQILEEGITEAGAMSSFIAAGTAHSTLNKHMIPFFIYYSMFGFQRIGDLIWAAADMRTRGFLIGGTAGRTTLNGEGLQHQDGHSLLQASVVPNILAYDPAFAFEIAIIIQNGIKRMYYDNEDIFYYLTLENENYEHFSIPQNVEKGIIKGIYLFKEGPNSKIKVQLFGSGSIINEVIEASKILQEDWGISSDIWSVTSYSELRRDGEDIYRYNRLNPDKKDKQPYINKVLSNHDGPVIAVSDYVKLVAEQVSPYIRKRYFTALGTDGFGRSDTRQNLRSHFEINKEYIVISALDALKREKKINASLVVDALKKYNINTKKENPIKK
ncbi:MAG: pyruvate dehydrogenase (acetyl-transferring), homodimeric type [Candidatus Marinimicrobia bacterium]|nr:pyruvate dehydrogenase (acetyl-transferring), homodimeric type [Candidatus Neomarinimicrobiota bacterium]